MAFSIGSYNVLANSYVRSDWFPHTPPDVLDWERRQGELEEAIVSASYDVICLQEVESDFMEPLRSRLESLGYSSHYHQKGQNKPDGCAIFRTREQFTLEKEYAWNFHDGGRRLDSGHVLLMVQLRFQDKPIAIANTHLKWSPPGTPGNQQWGLLQVSDFLLRLKAEGIDPESTILCGDFNVSPNSEVIQTLFAAGFMDAYAKQPHAWTCNPHQRVKRIDFIFTGRKLAATPWPIPPITNDTPLPSASQPSDHLPIAATIRWRHSESEVS